MTSRWLSWRRSALASTATSPTTEDFYRVQIAWVLADRDTARGTQVLASLATDLTLNGFNRVRAAMLLADRDSTRGMEALAAIAAGSTLDILEGSVSDRERVVKVPAIGSDPTLAGFYRAQAAALLTDRGDPRGVQVLATIATSPFPAGFYRAHVASVLVRYDAARGVQVLAEPVAVFVITFADESYIGEGGPPPPG